MVCEHDGEKEKSMMTEVSSGESGIMAWILMEMEDWKGKQGCTKHENSA